jgi:hypothetical protein
MKTKLFTILAFFMVFGLTKAQNLNNSFKDVENTIKLQPIDYVKKPILGLLTAEEKPTGFIFRPSKIYIDKENNLRYLFTYDNNGNVLTQQLEALEQGAWKGKTLEIFTYNSNGFVTSYTKKEMSLDSNVFVNKTKELYEYNSNNQPTLQLTQYWYTFLNNWSDFSRSVWTYNSESKVTKIVYEVAANNTWQTYTEYTYTYNNSGKVSNLLMKYFNPNINMLENKYDIYYYYDGNGYLQSTWWKQWINGNWENYILQSYIHNNKGLLTFDNYAEWVNNAWRYSLRNTYTYNQNDKILTHLMESFDPNVNDYMPFEYTLYGYVNDLLIEKVVQEYYRPTSSWVNKNRTVYTRNNNGDILTNVVEYWQDNGSYWLPFSKVEYTYDSYGNATMGTAYEYNNNSWATTLNNYEMNLVYDNSQLSYSDYAHKIVIEYEQITDVKDDINNNLTFKLEQNYPNPFNPATTINFTLPQSGLVTLKVYDILGNEVATLVNKEMNAGSNSIIWNAANLSSGVYFYTLNQNNYSITKKMLLLK